MASYCRDGQGGEAVELMEGDVVACCLGPLGAEVGGGPQAGGGAVEGGTRGGSVPIADAERTPGMLVGRSAARLLYALPPATFQPAR